MVGFGYVPSVLDKKAGSMAAIRIGTTSTKYVTGVYNLLDNDKINASLGLKFTVPKMWRLNGQVIIGLAYQFQYLVPVSVKKDGISYNITTNSLDDVAQTYMLNPSYKYSGMNHTFMVELGMRI